jgi:hypothetical protein
MKTNWGTGTDMTHCVVGMIIAIVLFAGTRPGWSQQLYLYSPKPVSAEERVQNNDLLVQEVSVKKGDTLYGISRIFSGHGAYYSQILLFNDIKNPNMIYPGNILKVPVSRKSATVNSLDVLMPQPQSAVPSVGPVKTGFSTAPKRSTVAEEKKRDLKQAAVSPAPKQAKTAKRPPAKTEATSEQRLFERAIKAYRQDDYRGALELFDRFLADYPLSALAADANLYKAECYLKQSN